MLLLGDGLGLVELVGPPLLAGGVGQLGLGHVEVGLGLGKGIPGVPRIDPNQRVAPLYDLAGLGLELKDLTGGFGFTSTVVSGWIAPDAWADTTISRRSTGRDS